MKRIIILLSLSFSAICCSGIREALNEPVKETTAVDSWGRVITKGDANAPDSLEAVRTLQTDEMLLLLSMISVQDSVYVLSLSKEESDSLGLSESNFTKAQAYLEQLNNALVAAKKNYNE